MDASKAKRVLAEAQKRVQRKAKLAYDQTLFGPQRAFIEDPSKRKAALCTRRAGKSHGVTVLLLKTLFEYDHALIPYITTTMKAAKDIVWSVFVQMDAEFDLGLKFNRNELSITGPTHSRIQLYGANDEAEIERLRGPKYPLVVIDEAQSFRPYITKLIHDIIEPATLDYDGTIVLTGTPNASCVGYFFDVTTNPKSGWSIHSWSLLDNPFLPEKRKLEFLEGVKKRLGGENSPTYQREYLGRWVRDEAGLVYRFNRDVNLVTEVPEGRDWQYTLGIDLGYSDSTAFVVLAFSVETSEVVVVESYKRTNLTPSHVAAHVERLRTQYAFNRIVADTGGIGKAYVEEMRQRFAIPVEPAQKRNKMAFIELLNGDLRSGILKVVESGNTHLLDEMSLLQWDNEALEEGKKVIDDVRYEDHLCDALLYGWRECRQYLFEPELNSPKPGTAEWWKAEEDRMEQLELDRLEAAENNAWWEAL